MNETTAALFQLAAFASQAGGGNPAGVWIGEELPSAAQMQALAAELGHSETAFLAPRQGQSRRVRCFSPQAEVSFCGHATIASGVVLGRLSGPGRYRLQTQAGEVALQVEQAAGQWLATLTSVEPRQRRIEPTQLDQALAALGWRPEQIDPSIPAMFAYAGAWHLVLAVSQRQTLDQLNYDFERLRHWMLQQDLTTLQLIWRAGADRFVARNPFPVGGVREDPATGAAAAALGGYLRDAGLLPAPSAFVIEQGEAIGRPSLLRVRVPPSGGIEVSGTALDIEA